MSAGVRFDTALVRSNLFRAFYPTRGVRKMMRVFVLLSLAVLACFSLQLQGLQADNRSLEGSSAKESSIAGQRAQSPREFIESRLGGRIVKLEKDPSDLLRAVLLVERKGSVIQHVLEASLNSDRELEDVRIITTNSNSAGIPPVIVIPLSVTSMCWGHCKEKCGQGTDCRMRCLF